MIESSIFDSTVIHVNVSTSGHGNNEVDYFYQQVKKSYTIYLRRTFRLYRTGTLNLKEMHRQNGEMFVDAIAMQRYTRKVSDA